MKSTLIPAFGLVALLAALPVAAQNRDRSPPPAAALTLPQAQAIATARIPGAVRHAEYEREHGRWIYTFDIQTPNHRMMEVNVDANTGAIVEVGPA